MTDEEPSTPPPGTAISKEEFARRDEELAKAMDDLEKKAIPTKVEPPEIGGVIGT